MRLTTPAPPPPWEDKPREGEPEGEPKEEEKKPTPEETEARRKLIEEAHEQTYLEAKKIYGTRFEAMGRLFTTLLGKGWFWNRGEAGKKETTERALKWIGHNIDLPLARFFEENKSARSLKIAGKIGVGTMGVAALFGLTGPAAFLIGAPLGVDGILDTIQFFKEREKVKAWRAREAKRKELETADEQRRNIILEGLENGKQAVTDLAGSKRAWGWARLGAKLAAVAGAGAWLHFHGIATGVKDLDKIHESTAKIINEHGGAIEPSNIKDVQDNASIMLDLARHGKLPGETLTYEQKHILELASWMDPEHQTVQHLNHAEFLYNRGQELDKALALEADGKLDVIHRGTEAAHWLSNQSMVGLLEAVFGAASADFAITTISAKVAPEPEAPRREEVKEIPELTAEQKENIEKVKEAPIIMAEQLGREGNTEKAFKDFIENNRALLEGIKDQEILIKVNLVDPQHPQSCTKVETVKKIIEMLKPFGPKKIYIGDIPSKAGRTRGKRILSGSELLNIYKTELNYQFVEPEVEVIDLEDLDTKEIDGVKIVDLSKFAKIFSVTLPKSHGNYFYSGACENLMGLLPYEERELMRDRSFFDEEVAKKEQEKKRSLTQEELRDLRDQVQKQWDENLTKFIETLLKEKGRDFIHILDGYEYLAGHQYWGTPREVNFALVSQDPLNIDYLTLEKLGQDYRKIGYLKSEKIPRSITKLVGDIGRTKLYPLLLKRKERPREYFWYILEEIEDKPLAIP